MAVIMEWALVPQHVLEATQNAVTQFPLPYASSSALAIGIQMLLVVTVGCWFFSVLVGNYSMTDRVWSLAPIAYVWHVAYYAYLEDAGQWNPRLVVMSVLATLWGLRLTFNFARKGGYSLKEEDYRWAVLRDKMPAVAYQLFNIVFIAGYQNVLIFLFTVPIYAAYEFRTVPLNLVDCGASILFILLLIMETVADQQQWVFYQKKYALLAAKKPLTGDYAAGFNRSGLFRFSRHPNFFAEESIWWAFYAFSIACSDMVVNPTIVGTLMLTMLFSGSSMFTEYVSAGKYPEYKVYQKTVSCLVPWFPASTKQHNA